MCPEEKELWQAEFARSPAERREADRIVRHKVCRPSATNLSLDLTCFGEYCEWQAELNSRLH